MTPTDSTDPTIGAPGTTTTTAAAIQAPAITNRDLIQFLDEINGMDTYNSKALATGKLDTKHYMMIPQGLARVPFDPNTIGKATSVPHYSHAELAQIYALNKAAFGTDERAIKIATLRMMAVRTGWHVGNYEVKEVPIDADAPRTFETDLSEIQRFTPVAKKLATLLPMVAEIVFRTMGHHYLTGLDSEYSGKYQRIFNACVEPTLTSYLPNADLYHTALHWVSLEHAFAVASTPGNIDWLPRAIVIRTTSAPAGTALVATSVAVLGAMDGAGLKASLESASGLDLKMLEAVVTSIKQNPLKFHTVPSAYNESPLPGNVRDELEEAKIVAVKLAPILQGFLDALPNSASLAQARALIKHADINPLMRRRAKVFFREAGTTKAATMGDLFSMDKRHSEALASDEVDEDE